MQPSFISQSLSSSLAKREAESETALVSWAKAKGLTIRPASKRQDMAEHIDYFLGANGQEISIDLKGWKEGQAAGLFLVELKNVQGSKGWVYGRADYILFQEGDSFLVIDRQRLADKVAKIKEWKKGGKFCRAPFYYSRSDRQQEAVTWLPRSEILECREEF